MSKIEDTITVAVPVRVAYDQWTQFEDFPKFMDGVERVEQLDDKRLSWKASIAGQTKEWIAEITDQTPDTRVAWKSVDGTDNAGAVTFKPMGANLTEVTLHIDADPDGVVEKAGDALGFLKRRVHGDLENFKKHIEAKGGNGKGWRGEIHGDEVQPDPVEVRSR
jgi:uncharacterized membrane protein